MYVVARWCYPFAFKHALCRLHWIPSGTAVWFCSSWDNISCVRLLREHTILFVSSECHFRRCFKRLVWSLRSNVIRTVNQLDYL